MMDEEEYIKTSFKIKKDLFLKARILAQDSTFTEILNKALEEYIKNHQEELKQKVRKLSEELSEVLEK